MSDRQQGRTGGPNVLVQTSAMDATGDKTCLDFLTSTPPSQSNVLFVSYIRSPDDWIQTWLEYTRERPATLGFIQVGETTRSVAAGQASDITSQTDRVVQPVGNPGNLTELGITISERLTQWDANPHDTVICFDSITALLQYTDGVQTAFQFLHTLIGRIQTAQARACYTIAPDAHDDQTVATLTGLFDDVLD